MKLRNILISSAAVAALVAAGLAGYTLLGGERAPKAGLGAGTQAAISDAQKAAGGSPAQSVQADVNEVDQDEHVLGDPDAPITIIEYSSLTCPHCASFHQNTLPKLKEEWIETGQAKLVYRHYPLDRLALAGAMLANCFEGDRFFAVLEMMFARQQQWARSETPGQELQKIASQAGMDTDTFNACVQDTEEARAILDKQEAGRKQAEVESTPTFLIDGEKISGAQPYQRFEEVLTDAQEGA
jgi:protein-disulfide isomerase